MRRQDKTSRNHNKSEKFTRNSAVVHLSSQCAVMKTLAPGLISSGLVNF